MEDLSQIKGFNYQPSCGTSGLELWMNFSADLIDLELGRGKRHFPGMNAIRFWLSSEAFNRDRRRFADNFTRALDVADRHGIRVMPVLFNRWHDPLLDYGGYYIDHFLPYSGWVWMADTMTPYVETIVGEHADDPRIFAWDLCNEPFAYYRPIESIPEIHKAECEWLKKIFAMCKSLGAKAPITVGVHPNTRMEDVREISDFISIHPYYGDNAPAPTHEDFETRLDRYVELSREWGRPLLATETCWGSEDDARRAEIVAYTLGELKKRGIGWLAYLLHHSLIADAHRRQYGPVGPAGNLSFIEADGTLRPGHDVFNRF